MRGTTIKGVSAAAEKESSLKTYMSAAVEQELLIDEWHGLYRESWKGVICDESFAHPAKFSRALIQRIYEHVIEEGWASKGDVVVDPFGGVALGAFPAMQHGLTWIGCELEERFVTLGNTNIALWNERYSRMPNWGEARLLQGDSRKLIEVLSASECCVSSPPYVSGGHHTDVMGAWNKNGGGQGVTKDEAGYGVAEGQLGAMKEGDHSLVVVTSPPYIESLKPETEEQTLRKQERTARSKSLYDGRKLETPSPGKAGLGGGYGNTEGNLGAMPEGQLVVSSPPYIDSVNSHDHGIDWTKVGPATGNRKRGKGSKHEETLRAQMAYTESPDPANLGAMPEGQLCVTSPPYEGNTKSDYLMSEDNKTRARDERRGFKQGAGCFRGSEGAYGQSEGQLGIERGETFWSASRLILEQLHQVLAPNAHAVFVTKRFVRDKKIVEFTDQWIQLCEAVGFRLLHRHKAMLVENYGTQGGFESDRKIEIARKSFFRRLAESKHSPAIDWEDVICFIKRA